MIKTLVFVFLIAVSFCRSGFAQATIQINDSVKVVQLSPHVWLHECGQYYPAFGKFTSNGLIYVSGNEAVMMDTPPSEDQAEALLNWFAEQFPRITIKAVIINHFHDDCLGGISAFHRRGIPSHANVRTAQRLKAEGALDRMPVRTFRRQERLQVGEHSILNFYPGPAHTADNIVTWLPDEDVLFGGCMVKSAGAGKGNIADADVQAWPSTMTRLLKKFSAARIVVPGHGDPAGSELLIYTRELFGGGSAASK